MRAENPRPGLGEKCKRKNEGCEQEEEQTQPVDPDHVLGTDRRDPSVTLDHLETGGGGVEVPPDRERRNGREQVETQSDAAGLLLLRGHREKRAEDGKDKQDRNHASHA